MPFVQIKLYEGELAGDAVPKLISKVTDAVCESTREELRPAVWVVVEGVEPSRWGIAGKPGGES